MVGAACGVAEEPGWPCLPESVGVSPESVGVSQELTEPQLVGRWLSRRVRRRGC